jgi:hypothetical protein
MISAQEKRRIQLQSVIETTKKFNISSKLFKLRYLCKCHLQLCAVLSQLNKHQEALYHGQMASFFCQQLIKNTHHLCVSYINRLICEKKSGGDTMENNNNSISAPLSQQVPSSNLLSPNSLGLSMGDRGAIDDEEDHPLHMIS